MSETDMIEFYDDEAPATITELETRTGIDRRTVHYYVQEGLLPPPNGTGGGAMYGAEHRVKLLLIKKLQREGHIKLKGIRQILERIKFSPVRNAAVKGASIGDDDLDSIFDRLAVNAGSSSSVMENRVDMLIAEKTQSKRKSGNAAKEDALNYSLLQNLQTVRKAAKRTPSGAETWQKVMVVDGLELLVRSDIEDKHGSDIEDAVRRLRKIIKR